MGENQRTSSVVSMVGPWLCPPSRYAMVDTHPARREESFYPLTFDQWQNRGREEESGYFPPPLYFPFFPAHNARQRGASCRGVLCGPS